MAHCRSVADLALEINRRKGLGLDQAAVEEAAMLHDIGIFMCDAPGIRVSWRRALYTPRCAWRRTAAQRWSWRGLRPCGRAPYRSGPEP
ncbi:HD domain-containing protein [Duncaniella muris]|uniref:HD domain-containing protein n=1 Tax=Duncaniella muris TaxID=2094150 RepID=UPI003F67EA78